LKIALETQVNRKNLNKTSFTEGVLLYGKIRFVAIKGRTQIDTIVYSRELHEFTSDYVSLP